MNRWLKIAIKLVLTAAILVFIFQRIPLENVVEVILASNPLFFALAVLMRLLQRILMGVRTRLLARHQAMNLSTGNLVSAGLIATFYGLFLPGSLAGGAVRWYKLNKIVSMPSEVLVLIAYDRMIDTVFMVALGLFFFLMDDAFWGNKNLGVDLGIAFLVLLGVYLLAFSGRVTRFFITAFLSLGFLPAIVKQKFKKLADVVTRFGELSFSSHIQLFLLSVFIYVVGVVAFVFLARGLFLDLAFDTLAWITSVVTAIVMLPITFSGLGVREAGLVVMLEPYGIEAASALAFSLLIFSSTVFLAAAGGIVELRQQYFDPRKKA